MSEQQLVNINGQQYALEDLSPNCQELLVRSQNGQNALAVQSSILELARIGLQVINNDITKLLPTDQDSGGEGELADKVVN